jgi:hypothetical protein
MDYDLAKLWPAIQPMIGDKYKTVKTAGQFKKQFNITGSYPANQPSTVAIKGLHVDGDLAVGSFDYDGLNLQNFILPLALDNGKLVTVYANKPAGQNTAAPAVANGGTLDIGNLTIDLTQSPPRLTVPANKVLITHLTINPLFADSYLGKILNNPAFIGAKEATGLLDLTMLDCNNLPLGDLLTQAVPANTGTAHVKYSLTDVTISSPLTSDLLPVLKQAKFDLNAKDATVAIAKGMCVEHMSLATGPYAMDIDGTVRLSDKAMVPLNLGVGPLAVMVEKSGVHDKNVLKVLPDRVVFPFKGTMDRFKLDTGPFAKELADASVKAAANGLLGGDKNNNGDNGLGGLLDKLKKKK